MGDDTWNDDIETTRDESLTEYRRREASDRLAENSERILKALVSLSIARQTEFDERAQRVYVSLLSSFDSLRVSRICADLAREARGEYDPAMPTVGEIISRCNIQIRRERDAEEERSRQTIRLLPNERIVPPERWAQFRRAVEQNIREKHSMR